MQQALGTLPWVRQVEVDLTRREVLVTVATDRYDRAAMIQVLKQKGYRAQVLREDANPGTLTQKS